MANNLCWESPFQSAEPLLLSWQQKNTKGRVPDRQVAIESPHHPTACADLTFWNAQHVELQEGVDDPAPELSKQPPQPLPRFVG